MKPPFLRALDFSEEELSSKNPLLELRIHVIRACNLRCIYCLSDAPFMEQDNGMALSLDEMKSNILQAKELGARVVSITGSGEPLMFNKIRELISFIRSIGLHAVLFTNSLLLNKSLARFLFSHKVNLMIKLNSLDEKEDDALVGIDGSHRIFLKKIKMLLEMGFADSGMLALNCVVTTQNKDSIINVFRFCRTNKIIPWIEPVTITGRAQKSLQIADNEIYNLFTEMAKIDSQEFGYYWNPDSPIVGADRRRYKYLCQIGLYGDVYHTDANITSKVGNIRKRSLHELIQSDEFLAMRNIDKHSKSIAPMQITESIFNILTSRRYRAGPKPNVIVLQRIINNILSKVKKGEPVKLLQFWGGCKNPNLPKDTADLAEEATLDNLFALGSEIQRLYPPGIRIFILVGDRRVELVNAIPSWKTQKYIKSLSQLTSNLKYNGMFTIVPLSSLYDANTPLFIRKLKVAKNRFTLQDMMSPKFEKLVKNASKNSLRGNSYNSALEYLQYRVAEEEGGIFRDFADCIRCFFIRYSFYYKQFIENIDETTPHLECSLIFFTGYKGNITQPWQAIGHYEDGKVVFLSQERLNFKGTNKSEALPALEGCLSGDLLASGVSMSRERIWGALKICKKPFFQVQARALRYCGTVKKALPLRFALNHLRHGADISKKCLKRPLLPQPQFISLKPRREKV